MYQRKRCETHLTERDKALLERLKGPNTPEMLLDLFPSYQTLYRRMNKLHKAGLIHVVGRMPNGSGNGRPVELWCRENIKIDNTDHEVSLQRLLNAWMVEYVRGKEVDRELLPDATLLLEPFVHVEMDRSTMDYPRIVSRMRKYERTDDLVLFVTMTERRASTVLRKCAFLRESLLACHYEAALLMGEALDCDGAAVPLSRLLRKS